ncbi:unnamed protein product, partial [Staurois parvus]
MISTLMISVAPSVPPVSAHQCHIPVLISATSMPHKRCLPAHITATYQCPISAAFHYQLSVPVSVTYHCHQC